MLAIANLVHETSTSTGTGNFTLASVNGKQSFNDAFSTGGTDVFHYFISNRDAAEWEYGSGHMSDATTLVRDTVIESSNSNSAVSFSAGVKDVTNDVPASERVAGPASSTAGYLPQFSDTSGKVFTSGKAAPSGDVVGTSDTQTLTNKTLTSPTISGSLTITAAGSVGIEIGRQDNVASTPYFDFHSGATSVDYDARLIASGGTGSNGGGILTVVGADFLAPVGSNAASVVTVGGSQTLTNKTLTDAIVGTQSQGNNSTKAASTAYVQNEIGSSIQAYDADTLKADTSDDLTAGFTSTSVNAGTKSSGTFTPTYATGGVQHCTNGGAFTLGVPTGHGSMILDITNNGSAGAITTSGFTKKTGDSFDTTNAHIFRCYITTGNGGSHLNVQAMF